MVDLPPGGFMNILATLRREAAKLQKQADKARQQLDNVRAAMKILGRERASSGKPIGRKKRVMSAAARAKISKATKARWAKFRAAKAKEKR
jgi:flagellar motility protein MotE (MotC chaperone)